MHWKKPLVDSIIFRCGKWLRSWSRSPRRLEPGLAHVGPPSEVGSWSQVRTKSRADRVRNDGVALTCPFLASLLLAVSTVDDNATFLCCLASSSWLPQPAKPEARHQDRVDSRRRTSRTSPALTPASTMTSTDLWNI